MSSTVKSVLKVKISGDIISEMENLSSNQNNQNEYRQAMQNGVGEAHRRKTQKEEESKFNKSVPEHFDRKIAEINQDIKRLEQTGEKAQRERRTEAEKPYRATDRHIDFNDLIQGDLGPTKEVRADKDPRESFKGVSFGRKEEEHVQSDLYREEGKQYTGSLVEERDKQRIGGLTNKPPVSNPFKNYLNQPTEVPRRNKLISIPEDIKAEMPKELRDVESSYNDKERSSERRFEEEKQRPVKEVHKDVYKQSESSSRPSRQTEDRNIRSGTSGSEARLSSNVESSTSSLRMLEKKFPKSMKNSKEIERIARIMDSKAEQNRRPQYHSSDSD